jgi:hypothetical protein
MPEIIESRTPPIVVSSLPIPPLTTSIVVVVAYLLFYPQNTIVVVRANPRPLLNNPRTRTSRFPYMAKEEALDATYVQRLDRTGR